MNLNPIVALAGYDPHLVARLHPRERRFFVWSAILAGVAAFGGGLGAAYGASFPFGAVVGIVAGLAFASLMLNLTRLLDAGSGYPVHLAIDEIDAWRPSGTAGAVLLVLGSLLSQPLVMLLLAFAHGGHGGLVDEVRAAWSRPAEAALLTFAIASLIAAPGWLRVIGAGPVRAYERERWIDDRMFVDDAFAHAQDVITEALRDVPGFKPPLAVHYADPPYNTHPLIYGLDPAVVVRNGIRLVRPKHKDALPPQEIPVQTPTQAPAPPVAAKVAPAPIALPPLPKSVPDEAVQSPSLDDASADASSEAPAPAYFDIGRMQAKRAGEHLDVAVPYIVALTGRAESEVRGMIKNAPPDVRLHQLFSDWKKLPTILLKDAGFALDHGFAPILAIVVGRPVDDVERRLRAAPREKRLAGVFAPELARRLLKKHVTT
ncbi:MAG TPA: hypothetical protein VGO62_17945 [Myxococcota bacterium]